MTVQRKYDGEGLHNLWPPSNTIKVSVSRKVRPSGRLARIGNKEKALKIVIG